MDPLHRLAERIRAKEARVAVIGLGYVGLPLLVGLDHAGYPTLGVEADPEKVGSLQEGRSYIVDITDSEVATLDRAEFSADPDALARADVLLICVPTPLTDHVPDLSMVRRAAESVARSLTPGKLVILESTTYPGTTEEIVRPILETSGLVAGDDFALAYSPERIDPGQGAWRLENTPKVVAGLTERCRDLAVSLYAEVVREVVTTSSPREAEMAKLVENTFRQVNIALVNELAILAKELEVDIWEALQAAATKPFGYMPFWPGPGVGGHCIAIDPSYLSWRAGQQLGYRIGFIEHANEVNNRMPSYVVARISEALNDVGRPIRGTRVLAIGVSYKAGVDDQRESPSLAVMQKLKAKGAEVSYHDPYVAEVALNGDTLRSLPLDEATLAAMDCVVVLTAHPGIDYRWLVRLASLVFDARGVTSGIDAPNVVRL
ncbi:MAG: nucleotide sugar dehydrogenase [Actinobacteria bacterium]|nr:nucleotide sugar dehydrogenase [Actinomycetota bacterium]